MERGRLGLLLQRPSHWSDGVPSCPRNIRFVFNVLVLPPALGTIDLQIVVSSSLSPLGGVGGRAVYGSTPIALAVPKFASPSAANRRKRAKNS